MLFAAVKVSEIVEVIWVSLAAGIGVTVLFSLVVLGSAKSAESRRKRRDGAATAYAGGAVLAFAAFAAVGVVGVQIMRAK